MSLRGTWQFVASWLFVVAFTVVLIAFMLVTLGAFSRHVGPLALRFWGRTMLRIAGVTLSVEGAEHLAADAMKIAPFNHGSVLDAFLVTAIMPPGSTAAVKRELMYYPLVGLCVYLLGFLIIDRGNGARARRTIDRAAARMARQRLTVFISPEGTRPLDGRLLPFKKGPLHLALDSGAPVVPVVIDNAWELHPPGRFTTTAGHVRIRVLPPRPSTGLTRETIAAETEALHDVYVAELARLRAERLGASLLPATAG